MTEQEIEQFDTLRESAIRNKAQMVILARIYNKCQDQDKQINVKGCTFCSSVKRKIYHKIIFEWYDNQADK